MSGTRTGRRARDVGILEGRTLPSGRVGRGPDPAYYSNSVLGTEAQAGAPPGAVESLAPRPSNPDGLYAGTVVAGVWKTTDATDSFPTWTPLTDHLPSLDISGL